MQGLGTGLRGPVLVAGDPGYDEARAIWNAMIDRRPAIVARCLGVSDVITGLRFAREHSLALSMRGGGHNIARLPEDHSSVGNRSAGAVLNIPTSTS